MAVVLEVGIALAVILGAPVLFTNAVEILGGGLDLGQGAVGSVLAAVGTALPETMIPIVAIPATVFFGDGGSGNALGGQNTTANGAWRLEAGCGRGTASGLIRASRAGR